MSSARLQMLLAAYCLTRVLFHVSVARIADEYGYRLTRDLALADAEVALLQSRQLLDRAEEVVECLASPTW